MKSFYRIFTFILVAVFAFSALNVISVSAQSDYIKPEKFIYGDVDLDGTVTIKDATFIQKDLARITYITAVQKTLANPDGTGYSIKNATSIQKYLAKYETSTLWATELVMASQDEFSKNIYDSEFEEDYFLVCVKSVDNIEYSLVDFPEYDFKSLEFNLAFENIGLDLYKLYLEMPGRDNVIEAIKALDYRANIDISFAEPEYIYYVVDD